MKHLLFTVTNELNHDQRMIRICSSLASNGYSITLVGVKFHNSLALNPQLYAQKRIKVWSKKGPLFYAMYNIKLFFYLLFTKADLFCCIDLDTMMPVYFASLFKHTKRVYDAHEYFSQLKEIVTRPKIYKIWYGIEKKFVPKFKDGYTVSTSIAKSFEKLYGVQYQTIRNIPLLQPNTVKQHKEKKIIYQGAVNEGRGFEGLIPAMQFVDAVLYIYGDGNFMAQARRLINKYAVSSKVILRGKFLPTELNDFTADAHIGINLVEHIGLNQYFSLANKFFDYMHAGIPQITMNFPEYAAINDQYDFALLVNNIEPQTIAEAINNLLHNDALYLRLRENCFTARKELNWQNEATTLLNFYKNIFE